MKSMKEQLADLKAQVGSFDSKLNIISPNTKTSCDEKIDLELKVDSKMVQDTVYVQQSIPAFNKISESSSVKDCTQEDAQANVESKSENISDENKTKIELVYHTFVDVICNKTSFDVFYSRLSKNRIRLNTKVKKALRKRYLDAIERNFLDTIELKIFLFLNFSNIKKSTKKKKQKRPKIHSREHKQHQRRESPTVATNLAGTDYENASCTTVKNFNKDAGKAAEYLYKQESKKPATEKIAQLKNNPQIGLGLESDVHIPQVKRTEVVIDTNTRKENLKKSDKSIIYAAGWSMKNSTD